MRAYAAELAIECEDAAHRLGLGWIEDERVLVPLKPNSLLSWENTGNFVRLGLRVRLLARMQHQIQRLTTQFPAHRNREFIAALQGIESGH